SVLRSVQSPHLSCTVCFFLMIRLPPKSPLFPYTTLFRSTPASSAPVLQTPKATSHQQTQNQRYGSSHIGATAKDISNVVTDAARSEERFSRNAETDLVCRLLLEKKK